PLGGAAEFDERDFLEEPLDHLHAVAALRPLAPRLEERPVVVIVRGDLEFARRAIFHREFDAALPLVGVPDGVVEAELHLLLDVARKVIGRDPARVDVEGGLAGVRVPVDDLELHRVPRRAVRGADGFSMRTCLPAARAARAGAKWRSSGVATQTTSTPAASSLSVASGPAKFWKAPSREFGSASARAAREPVREATAASATATGPVSGVYRGTRAAASKNGQYVSSKIIPKPTMPAASRAGFGA